MIQVFHGFSSEDVHPKMSIIFTCLLKPFCSCCREISAEAILDLDIFNLSADKSKRSSGTGRRVESDEEEDLEDNSPLFWQPGKRGYYAPRVGKATPERISAYRNVGR